MFFEFAASPAISCTGTWSARTSQTQNLSPSRPFSARRTHREPHRVRPSNFPANGRISWYDPAEHTRFPFGTADQALPANTDNRLHGSAVCTVDEIFKN